MKRSYHPMGSTPEKGAECRIARIVATVGKDG